MKTGVLETNKRFSTSLFITLNALLTGDLIHWTEWGHFSIFNIYLKTYFVCDQENIYKCLTAAKYETQKPST